MIAIVRVENTHTDNGSNSQSRKHTQIMVAIVKSRKHTHR